MKKAGAVFAKLRFLNELKSGVITKEVGVWYTTRETLKRLSRKQKVLFFGSWYMPTGHTRRADSTYQEAEALITGARLK